MERHVEREAYYEETNYRTEVGKDGLRHLNGVKYNHVHLCDSPVKSSL